MDACLLKTFRGCSAAPPSVQPQRCFAIVMQIFVPWFTGNGLPGLRPCSVAIGCYSGQDFDGQDHHTGCRGRDVLRGFDTCLVNIISVRTALIASWRSKFALGIIERPCACRSQSANSFIFSPCQTHLGCGKKVRHSLPSGMQASDTIDNVKATR